MDLIACNIAITERIEYYHHDVVFLICRSYIKMVCISCIVIPAFLYVWHRWLQPLIMPLVDKYWYGREPLSYSNGSASAATDSNGMKCPFGSKVSFSES